MVEKAARPGPETGLHAPPKERAEFRKMLALNPNYFGNIKESSFKAVKKIIGNTTFEELTCLGFNPSLNLLEATIQVKLPGGYSGTLCTPGSIEYVRFYIDYGAGWKDVGVGSLNAHDIPNSFDCAKDPEKPLAYVVTQSLAPRPNTCRHPMLPKVRAILSWQLEPPAGDPDWPPIWGNVVDRRIQIRPRPAKLHDVIDLIPKEALQQLPPLLDEAGSLPIPLPDPPPLSVSQLAGLYVGSPAGKSGSVEPHRFGLEKIETALALADQHMLTGAIAEWKAAGLDWSEAVAALEKTKADVSYEELECLGLDYGLERLVATLRIKRKSGYSGGLCSPGSQEYVAFWADWNNTCEWTYLNTVSVNVHDIDSIPSDGLAYSAILPVDLNAVRRPCGGPGGGPNIGRIRAVLSWSSLPSTVDPDALNHWGNRVDAHVQIRPGESVSGTQPVISIIGGIGLADINVIGNGMTTPTATFAFGGSAADPWLLGRPCPFGGLVIVQGPPVLGSQYRLWARKSGDPPTEQVVRNTFHVVNWLGVGSNRTPDPATGFASYVDTLSNINQVLAHWIPPGDELWEIRLELADMGGIVSGTTPWYRIQLDNTAPRRRPHDPPFEPPAVACEIHIDSGGDCKDFVKGIKVQGRFVARDSHFGGFSLRTLPSSMSPPNPTTPTSATSETASFAAGGDAWELATATMDPCGYVVLLEVWDRSILNSVPGQHNYNFYDVGFCLRA